MYKPYQRPIINASPDVKVAQPKVSGFAIFLMSLIAKPYMKMLFGSAKIVLHDKEILIDAFNRALSKKNRCIIAFRHPDGREPQLLTWFFLFKLKPLALKQKVQFACRPHAVFVYGYEVVRWGPPVVRIIFPKLGAIPIHHTKIDSKGMAKIYSTIIDGKYPLALAPEGQVSYSTDTVPRLEPGVVHIGFQAASQLLDNNNNCQLEILPLSVHFRYNKRGIAAMEKLLSKIEKYCALESQNDILENRLQRCRNIILEINEKRYNLNTDTSLSFEERLKNVVNAALETAERMLGVKSEGDYFARLYKVRHECWDRIFLPGVDNFKNIPLAKRSVMDLKAGEAWHIARHQELADFGWYFCKPVPAKEAALHEKVEYVQNLWDFASRTMGAAISARINIAPSKVIIKAAEGINLSERLSLYKEDKKGAILQAVSDLENAYIECINKVNKEVPY